MRTIVLLVMIFVVQVSAYSRLITVSGIATDSTGAPLPYTDIVLRHSNLKIMSNDKGEFSFKARPLQRITFLWCHCKPVFTRLIRTRNISVFLSVNKSFIIK